MTTFSNKSKKSYFWYIFWTKKKFENIPLYHAQQHHAEFRKKLMRRKNFRTEGRKDGGTERRTDRPEFMGNFRSQSGVQRWGRQVNPRLLHQSLIFNVAKKMAYSRPLQI